MTIIKDRDKLKKIIKQLNIKFNILNESSAKELLNYIYENNFYTLSISNIKFILKYKNVLNVNDFDTKNYSSIKESKLDNLIDYVDNNIDEYIENIYLKIESKNSEKEECYIDMLNNKSISTENKTKIIVKVKTLINNVNEIVDIDVIKSLLVESKILATWENLINIYVQNKNKFIPEITFFINVTENSKKLSKIRIQTDVTDEETVKSFLISLLLNEEIKDNIYFNILSSVPYIYNSLSFENLSFEKVKSLIIKNILTVNNTNYALLKENFENLHILLVENNPNVFIKEIENFEIENEDLLSFLKSKKISIQIKGKLIESYETSIFTLDSDLLTQIGKLLLENNNLNIDNNIITAIGTDSNLKAIDKIRLFNKWNRIYDDGDIETFLISLGEPYSLITKNGKRPLLSNNIINKELAGNLKIKGYISKYEIEKKKLKKNGIRISTFKNK